jgi:SAM-dependent methyltransferase
MAAGLDAPIGHAWLSFSTMPMLRTRRTRLLAKGGGQELDLGGRAGLADLAARPDASVDTVISIFTLCSVPDLAAVLAGVRRVLRPTGQFLFLEHVPGWPGARRPGDLIGPTWRMMGRCDPTRDVPEAVRRGGFVLMDLERFTVPTLAIPLRSCVAGLAVLPEGEDVR